MKIHYINQDAEDIVIEELSDDKLRELLRHPMYLRLLSEGEDYYNFKDKEWVKKKGRGFIAGAGEKVDAEKIIQKLKEMDKEREVICKYFNVRLVQCLWCEYYEDYLNRMKPFWKDKEIIIKEIEKTHPKIKNMQEKEE